MKVLPFEKPRIRHEPPRRERTVEKINSCASQPSNIRYISWIFLGMLPCEVLSLPANAQYICIVNIKILSVILS